MNIEVITGKWTEDELDRIIRRASEIDDSGRRINFLSAEFLGTSYRDRTLIGDCNTPEVLVVNLEGIDCFTFIDYIEAMRLSGSFPDFLENLKKIRYKNGMVSFEGRNHFFTDWKFNAAYLKDATAEIGKSATLHVRKILNKKDEETSWIPGLLHAEREIKYIPTSAVTDQLLGRLRTGDYAGIYSEAPGLDVSHVGIIIKGGEEIYLRHASSRHRKVVDEDLKDYISGKPGLTIFRPLDITQ